MLWKLFLWEIVVVSRTQLFISAGHQPRNQDCGFGVILSSPPLTRLSHIFARKRSPPQTTFGKFRKRLLTDISIPLLLYKNEAKNLLFSPSPSSVELIIFGHPIYLAPTKKTKIKYPKPVNNDLKRKTAESPLEDFFLKKERRRRFPTSFIMFCVVSFSA